MNIPSMINEAMVGRDGKLTDTWRTIFNQLFSQLQANASNEGLIAPSQSTTDITKIQSDAKNGAFLYDHLTHEIMVCINGVFKKITTS